MEPVNTFTEHDRLIQGSGTTAADWRHWLDAHLPPAVDIDALSAAHGTLWVVAPHPDDEVLLAGGLLALLAQRGRLAHVVAVTDGEASHPRSTRWPVDALAAARREETARALAQLAPGTPLQRLGVPDGGVAKHERDLAIRLASLFGPRDVVLTTWRLDGHPDHEATGRACASACRLRGARLYEVPVWAWHWAPAGDPRLPWTRAVSLPLGAQALESKRLALLQYTSQTEPDPCTGASPVLPGTAIARLLHPYEILFSP